MLRAFAVLTATLVLLGSGTGLRSQQAINASAYLEQIAKRMENSSARTRFSNSIFILNSMNEAFSTEIHLSPSERAERFQKLTNFSLYIQHLPPSTLLQAVTSASSDFDKALVAYNKFANAVGISRNNALYEDGRAAIAITALATRTADNPISAKSACDSFFLKWICDKFG